MYCSGKEQGIVYGYPVAACQIICCRYQILCRQYLAGLMDECRTLAQHVFHHCRILAGMADPLPCNICNFCISKIDGYAVMAFRDRKGFSGDLLRKKDRGDYAGIQNYVIVHRDPPVWMLRQANLLFETGVLPVPGPGSVLCVFSLRIVRSEFGSPPATRDR